MSTALAERQEVKQAMSALNVQTQEAEWCELEVRLEELNLQTGLFDCTECGEDFDGASFNASDGKCPECVASDHEATAHVAMIYVNEFTQTHAEDCGCGACLLKREWAAAQ